MDVLVAIIDCNQFQWGQRTTAATAQSNQTTSSPSLPSSTSSPSPLTFTSFVDQLIIFLNAFLILNKSNQLCVIGMDAQHADFIWPTPLVHQRTTTNGRAPMDTDESKTSSSKRDSKSTHSSAPSADASNSGHDSGSIGVDDELIKQLHNFATRPIASTNDGPREDENSSKMAGALSLGLCCQSHNVEPDLNRIHNQASSNPSSAKLRSRILLFSLCPDESSSYVSMMNGIFSTQKQSIPVDSCVLHENDSLFLQQASHLTQGIYGRVPIQKQHSLLQYLMFMYLSDPTSRQHLILPTQTQVDFRATCFCHQQVVNLAVVCPVCLAIFCRSTPKCAVCQTRFAVIHQAQPGIPRPTTPSITSTTAR